MMKKNILTALGLSLTMFLSAQNGSLTINTQKEGVALSPDLYGIFFEDINMAGDGGIYAEMIRNRSFEDIRPPESCLIKGNFAISPGGFRWEYKVKDSIPSWKLVTEGNALGNMHLDTLNKLNAAQLYALKINVTSNDQGRVAVKNEGYWGIACESGKQYNFSFYARSASPLTEKLKVTLEDETGKIYASSEIAGISKSWKKYSATLVPNATNNKLKLVFSLSKSNTLWLDMVSLFPVDTWNKRENGMRTDLMQMLSDLKPRFFRFPGGCVVEGVTFENMIRWKTTMGDIAERSGHLNVWGYRTSDGMGMHEFLQVAEDLGAEPLYVINVGITCQARNEFYKPLDELQPMIQDALDALEYANGPVSSKWGALRAKNGHPKPFNLKYLEIGNENWGTKYDERYLRFYDAVKAKYPDIITIRSAHPTADKNPLEFPENKGDILDLHYYRSPDWLFRNHYLLDTYERKDKLIYIGEYACNEKVGRGNLLSGLADASFMLSFERNGDIVRLASYAPLFENEDKDGYKWPVNLIHYNNHQTYAIPSYYVQKMLSENKGDITLVSDFRSDSVKLPGDIKLNGGCIGFDTYSTEAVFDDVLVVSGKDTLLNEDFSKLNTQFPLSFYEGDWVIENGELHQKNTKIFAHAFMGNPMWKNYTATFRAKKIKGAEGFFMTVNQIDEKNCVKWNIGGWNNSQHALEFRSNGISSYPSPMVPGKINDNEWYNVKVEAYNNTVKCYLNGQLVHDVAIPEFNSYQRLYSVVTKDKKSNTIMVKVVNPFESEAKLDIALTGDANVNTDAEEIVLTSDNLNDNNSFNEPLKVSPKTRTVSGISNKFTYTFKPRSLTILKMKIKE
jgi:alpha-L-arabinofuranosidase